MTTKKPIGPTPGWVNRNPHDDEMSKLLEFAATELGLLYGVLDGEKLKNVSADGEEWRWEDFQLRYFAAGRFYIANKTRQAGMSAAFSAKALAKGTLAKGNSTGIFVSYKKEEAIGKINYVKAFLECLPPRFRKKIIRDPLHLVEWKNPNGTISKIISHAQNPVRGHHGDAWLDEFHFFQQDKLIYDSIQPVTAQVGGTIDIVSTPFGKGGVFYDIIADSARYPQYTREWIYWWWCRRYLKDPSDDGLEKAMLEAPRIKAEYGQYASEEIVNRFGNNKIKTMFLNLDLITFQQEFEGYFVDEKAFYFPRSLIMRCMFDDRPDISEYSPREADFTIPVEDALAQEQFSIQQRHPNVLLTRFSTLEGLVAAVRSGRVSPTLLAGVDVGATEHASDIRILEEIPETFGGRLTTLQVERFARTEHKWPLQDMQDFLIHIMSTGLIQKMSIDATGIGFQMGQTLERMFPGRVQALHLSGSNQIKGNVMANLKNRMEADAIALAMDRITIEDLHSIQAVTNAASVTFKTAVKDKRHGDSAWSIGFASYGGTAFGQPPKAGLKLNPSVTNTGYRNPMDVKTQLSPDEYSPTSPELKAHAASLKRKTIASRFARKAEKIPGLPNELGQFNPNWNK